MPRSGPLTSVRLPNGDSHHKRLQPPSSLNAAERSVFENLIAATRPDHFIASDLPLLARYCEAIVLGDRAAVELRKNTIVNGKASPWVAIQEKATKSMIMLSMRLRLSPQSRVDQKTIGRMLPHTGRRPWEDDWVPPSAGDPS